jgi:hypothetical protein
LFFASLAPSAETHAINDLIAFSELYFMASNLSESVITAFGLIEKS